MQTRKYIVAIYLIVLLYCWSSACKKFIDDADLPKDQVVTENAFTDSSTMLAMLSHIYARFGISGGTIEGYFAPYTSLYADEIIPLNVSPDNEQYYNDGLKPDNSINGATWQSLYSVIYECNAFSEGLNGAQNISSALKNQFTGEAKFLRAFAYFLLVNCYGDIPLVLITDVTKTANLSRTPSSQVYEQIINDLEEALNSLQEEYPSQEKVLVNKWAAEALLAKVMLYQQHWQEAEDAATTVINSGLYTPLESPSVVFLKNSKETILQFYETYGYTWSGNYFLPFFGTPNYALTSSLLDVFERDDLRRQMWMDSIDYNGNKYYYPAKYKNNPFNVTNDGEYTMCLRVAEQYLIRAEARCMQNKIAEAIEDLNAVRARAALSLIVTPISNDSCMRMIAEERRRELFTEWGNRFFDLKRTGAIDSVMSKAKATWTSNAALFPIPQSEMNYNANLVQNPGY